MKNIRDSLTCLYGENKTKSEPFETSKLPEVSISVPDSDRFIEPLREVRQTVGDSNHLQNHSNLVCPSSLMLIIRFSSFLSTDLPLLVYQNPLVCALLGATKGDESGRDIDQHTRYTLTRRSQSG